MVEVGDRVIIAKEKATVRYVGEVVGQTGTWMGVEWDDPSRGKHDGSTGGKRYFTTTAGPTAGSFVRSEKVGAGCDVLSALQERYFNRRAEGAAEGVTGDDAVYLDTNRRRILVEMVGEDKVQARQSQLHLLTQARLVGLGVARVGAAGELGAAAPSIREFDLTDNLISSWRFAADLCRELPALVVLNLSGNRLALPATPAGFGYPDAAGLQALVLNGCGVTWAQLVVLQEHLPALKELHVCGNAIADLRASDELPHTDVGFKSLQVLNLEDNGVSQWAEVLRLAALPSLTKLHLSSNPLTDVWYPAASDAGCAAFARLEALFLGSCKLTDWKRVSELDKFPALRELRLSGNPLLEGAKSGGRYEIIGRVAALTSLNGAAIRPRDRRDAEVRYLQNIVTDTAELGSAEEKEAFEATHPRLDYLKSKYGALLVGTGSRGAAQGSALAATMAEVNIVQPGVKSSKKKLPRSMTVGALKTLIERLFRVKADRQLLQLKAGGAEALEDISDDDSRALSWFGIVDGDEIRVDEVDPEERAALAAAAREAERREAAARAAAQLVEGDKLKAAAASAFMA